MIIASARIREMFIGLLISGAYFFSIDNAIHVFLRRTLLTFSPYRSVLHARVKMSKKKKWLLTEKEPSPFLIRISVVYK